jgi:hypothetical protein
MLMHSVRDTDQLSAARSSVVGAYLTARLTWFGETRATVALQVCNALGDGGTVELELVRRSASSERWHAERIGCASAAPVALEFLRDLLDAQHWSLTAPAQHAVEIAELNADPMTLEGLLSFLETWRPARS